MKTQFTITFETDAPITKEELDKLVQEQLDMLIDGTTGLSHVYKDGTELCHPEGYPYDIAWMGAELVK